MTKKPTIILATLLVLCLAVFSCDIEPIGTADPSIEASTTTESTETSGTITSGTSGSTGTTDTSGSTGTSGSTSTGLLTKVIATYGNGVKEVTLFTYSGNNLVRIDDEDKIGGDGKIVTNYEYDTSNKLIKSTEFVEGELLNVVDYTYDLAGKLIKVTENYTLNNVTSVHKNYYQYNANGTVTVTESDSSSEYTWTLNGGNVMSITETGGNIETSTYDSKNSPLFNISSRRSFMLNYYELYDNNLLTSISKDSSGKTLGSSSFSYTYNSDGYPISGLKTSSQLEPLTNTNVEEQIRFEYYY